MNRKLIIFLIVFLLTSCSIFYTGSVNVDPDFDLLPSPPSPIESPQKVAVIKLQKDF